MTEHPAAPTTEDETWIDLTIAMRAYMQDRNGWGAVEDAMRARDDFHRAEARAAARKEVERLAAEWETAAKRIGDRALMGDPAVSVAVAQSLQSCARAILDSLSTNTREEHGDHES